MKNKRAECDTRGICWALEGRMDIEGWSDYGLDQTVERNPVTGEPTDYDIVYYPKGGMNILLKYCLFCGGSLGKSSNSAANSAGQNEKNNTAQCDTRGVCQAMAAQIEYEKLSDYGFEKISDEQRFVGVAYRSETDSDGTDIYISHCPFCGGRPGEIANKNATAKEEAENGSN